MPRLVQIAVVCSILSCAPRNYGEQGPNGLSASGGAQPGYAIKQVVEKRKPSELVADDGSVCRTSAERFTAAAVGKWINCDWKPS